LEVTCVLLALLKQIKRMKQIVERLSGRSMTVTVPESLDVTDLGVINQVSLETSLFAKRFDSNEETARKQVTTYTSMRTSYRK